MYLFYAWVWSNGIPFSEAWPVCAGILVASVALAWAALRFYDTPLRESLSKRFLRGRRV